MSKCLPFVFYFSHLHYRHVWKFWIISRRWTHQTKRLPFLLINHYFSSLGNSKFSWICSGEEKKCSQPQTSFIITPRKWQVLLGNNSFCFLKFEVRNIICFFHQTTNKMNDIILLPQELELYVLSRASCSHFQHRGVSHVQGCWERNRKGENHTTVTG